MKPENAERVLELSPALRACATEQRADFLKRACAGRRLVRVVIDSLLHSEAPAPDSLAQPVFGRGLEVLSDTEADGDLKAGDTLGDCRVISLLGVGGIGEIYLAEDTIPGRQSGVQAHPAEFRRLLQNGDALVGRKNGGSAYVHGHAVAQPGRRRAGVG